MKTIFRYTNLAVLLTAIFALGAAAGMAQNPCEDAEGQLAANNKITDLFKDKTIAGRKSYLEAGKSFLEKYGECPSAKDLAEYLKPQLPKLEVTIKQMEADKAESELTVPFDAALKAKNWDDAYSYGKQILANYPDKYRTVEIVLGSIGGEEALKGNLKYTDDMLRYAKQSIADLEANKPFVLGKDTKYGISLKGVYNFEYLNKEDALGWLNYYVGYVTQVAQKNKVAAAPYLYKATQLNSDTKSKPVPYEYIGAYYFDEVIKLAGEVDALVKTQNDKDPEDVAKQKVEAIKAKVALVNGTSEAAIDAYARAYNLAKADPKAGKPYVDALNKKMVDLFAVRFGKPDGFDVFVAATVKKPFANPALPVKPVSDPEPASTTTTTNATPAPATTPAATVKPVVTTPVKPAGDSTVRAAPAPATKTVAKPVGKGKPQATVKKTVAKKKAV